MSDMGTGEMGTPTKTTKTSTPQEQPPSTMPMSYPEWAAAFQAYYSGTAPPPPPGYFPSSVGSGPQPHPYMWGAQPMMPPYGTPPPYASMYPPGGIYAHPSMPPGTHPYNPYGLVTGNASDAQAGATSAGTDAEGKSADAKKKSPTKRSKGSLGSLGMLTGKESDAGKGTPMNGVFSQSGDSGSEGSTDGSEGNSQNGSQGTQKGSYDPSTSEAPGSHAVTSYGVAQDVNHGSGKHPAAAMPISIAGKQVVGAGPLTNLHIGMDYWSGGTPSVLTPSQGKRGPAAVTTTAMIPSSNMIGPGRDAIPSELWLQDERELKRQRRKQSNRESARRSRLRKQAECEELAARVETLTAENLSLRSELNSIREQCQKLSGENRSLVDQLRMRRSHLDGTEGESEKNDTDFSKSENRDSEEGLQLDNGFL